MQKPEAIETYYNGYRFRSRLEARWAVVFDAMGIKYRYEEEGYKLRRANGWCVQYLPDFHLPELGMWCECKGVMTAEDAEKVRLFREQVGRLEVLGSIYDLDETMDMEPLKRIALNLGRTARFEFGDALSATEIRREALQILEEHEKYGSNRDG